MRLKVSIITFLSIMAAGISAYLVAWSGLYPVAVVNYHFITAQDFDNNFSIVYDFSRNVAAVSGGDMDKINSPGFSEDLRLKVLDDMISREMILRELDRRVGLAQANAIAERNIDNALSGKTDTADGIEKLYGMSLAEFREKVLIPQAYEEILAGRMHLQNQNFEAWLNDARKTGSVLIFYPGFSWESGKLIEK